MTARLHAELAYILTRLNMARVGQRHYYGGIGWPVNDNGWL
jgi:hypothetical protein